MMVDVIIAMIILVADDIMIPVTNIDGDTIQYMYVNSIVRKYLLYS